MYLIYSHAHGNATSYVPLIKLSTLDCTGQLLRL